MWSEELEELVTRSSKAASGKRTKFWVSQKSELNERTVHNEKQIAYVWQHLAALYIRE